MSRKGRYKKCTMRAVQLVALPGHPQLAIQCCVLSKGSRSDTSWLHTGVGGGCRSQVSLAHPVLYLPMGIQATRYQVRIALRAAKPLTESLPVTETLSPVSLIP